MPASPRRRRNDRVAPRQIRASRRGRRISRLHAADTGLRYGRHKQPQVAASIPQPSGPSAQRVGVTLACVCGLDIGVAVTAGGTFGIAFRVDCGTALVGVVGPAGICVGGGPAGRVAVGGATPFGVPVVPGFDGGRGVGWPVGRVAAGVAGFGVRGAAVGSEAGSGVATNRGRTGGSGMTTLGIAGGSGMSGAAIGVGGGEPGGSVTVGEGERVGNGVQVGSGVRSSNSSGGAGAPAWASSTRCRSTMLPMPRQYSTEENSKSSAPTPTPMRWPSLSRKYQASRRRSRRRTGPNIACLCSGGPVD